MAQTYPIQAISQLLKLSERRVQQLVKDGILPRPAKGEYDAIACIHSYIDYLKKLAQGNGELSLTEERTRYTKYQADIAEITLRKERGQIIDTQIAMKVWGEVVTSVRQKLLGMPTRLAPLIATSQSIPEIKDRLDHAIEEVLNEFTNPDLTGIAGNKSSSKGIEVIPTPAKTNHKPVGGQRKKVKPGIER